MLSCGTGNLSSRGVGSRSGEAREFVMPSGRIAGRSAQIIGNTCLAMNVLNPTSNRNAGLDVSPAVRDYVGLSDIDVCDWKFVEFREVPSGPWAMYGDNSGDASEGAGSRDAGGKGGANGRSR